MMGSGKLIEKVKCPFCGNYCQFSYWMGKYSIFKCTYCGTAQSYPKPSLKELAAFYEGFSYKVAKDNKPFVYESAELLFNRLGLCTNKNNCMLDVGGGGGFYAKAYEDMGYGKSTYVDLDRQACEVAKTLGIKNVINADAEKYYFPKKYDFIMCRHLIEHLTNPTLLIKKLFHLLSPDGQLLLICPNGESVEYLAYPKRLMRKLFKIYMSNFFGGYCLVKTLFGGHFNHEIEPVRHLWAITPKGLSVFCEKSHFKYTVNTYNLTDIAFSPYYRSVSILNKLASFFADNITGSIKGGAQLAVIIQK